MVVCPSIAFSNPEYFIYIVGRFSFTNRSKIIRPIQFTPQSQLPRRQYFIMDYVAIIPSRKYESLPVWFQISLNNFQHFLYSLTIFLFTPFHISVNNIARIPVVNFAFSIKVYTKWWIGDDEVSFHIFPFIHVTYPIFFKQLAYSRGICFLYRSHRLLLCEASLKRRKFLILSQIRETPARTFQISNFPVFENSESTRPNLVPENNAHTNNIASWKCTSFLRARRRKWRG